MATLSYKHFGNPGRRGLEAHYNVVHKKPRLGRHFEYFGPFYVKSYSHALHYLSRRPHAAAAGSRGLAAAIFLFLYIHTRMS